MNKLLAALALGTAAIAAPAAAQTLPPAVIVLVDLDQVINNSAAAKAAQPELKAKADTLQARVQQLRTQFQNEGQELQKAQPAQGAPAATVTAFQTKVRDLQTRQEQAQQELQRREAEFNASRSYVVKQINDAAQPIISTIMRERGASIVLNEQATLQHAAAVDVTNDVVARLDKALPRVSTTPPAAPAPAAAAPATPPTK